MSRISENLRCVKERIDAAAKKSGRSGSDVTLVAVTKTRSIEEIQEAIACGVTDIGENYVQEAEAKYAQIGGGVRWHMIGHLQRNKVKHAVEVFDVVQSVDSEALAREIGRRADMASKRVDVLIEAHISGEESKFGVEPERVIDLAEKISNISGIRVCGLMGMAPFLPDPEMSRPYFSKLKRIWDKLPKEQRLYLSMGMTQDFEAAIEEGSNMVRIGTAIFGPRE